MIGESDYWIVKLNNAGKIQWDKAFGTFAGSFSELSSLQQTEDGGYILGGSTADDYWVVNVDSVGKIQWDKQQLLSGFTNRKNCQ